MVYSAVLAARTVMGSSPSLDQTSTNACSFVCKYVDQKGLAAILTSKQSAGVTPELNLRITQARKGSTLALKPGQKSPEVQNRGISGPHKKD